MSVNKTTSVTGELHYTTVRRRLKMSFRRANPKLLAPIGDRDVAVTVFFLSLLGLILLFYVLFCCHVWGMYRKIKRLITGGSDVDSTNSTGDVNTVAVSNRDRIGMTSSLGPPPRYSEVYDTSQDCISSSIIKCADVSKEVKFWRISVITCSALDTSYQDLPVFDSPVPTKTKKKLQRPIDESNTSNTKEVQSPSSTNDESVINSTDSGYKSKTDPLDFTASPANTSFTNTSSLSLIHARSAKKNQNLMSPRVQVHSSRSPFRPSLVSGSKWGSYLDIISESGIEGIGTPKLKNNPPLNSPKRIDHFEPTHRSPLGSLPSYRQCFSSRDMVSVRLQVPTGCILNYMIARKEADSTYIAVMEPHPVFPINACSLQISSGNLRVESVLIDCLSEEMKPLESYCFGMI